MSTTFAAAQARLGASTVARQANAVLSLPGGAEVEGIFRRDAAEAAVGAVGMRTRDATFRCMQADLAAPIAKGSQLVVQFQGAPTVWKLAQATPQLELGQVLLELEAA